MSRIATNLVRSKKLAFFDQVHYDAPSESFSSAVRVVTVDLQPGELLWLPAYWVHAVEALTPTVSVSVVAPTPETALFENIQGGGLT